MGIETFKGLGDYNIPDEYSEEDKEIIRKRILLESELDYQKLHEYTPLISVLKDEYKKEHNTDYTGDVKELVDQYAWDMTWFEDNEASMFSEAMQERTDQEKYDMGLKVHIWDRVHNRDWWKIARDHSAAMVSSPTNIASVVLAPFTLGQSLWLKGGVEVAKQGAKQAVKQSFLGTMKGNIKKNIHKNIVKTTALEAGLGGLGEGLHEYYEQDVEQDIINPETMEEYRKEKDYTDILLQSTIGAGTAAGITGGLYIGGKALHKAISKQMASSTSDAVMKTPFDSLKADKPFKKLFGENIVVDILKRGFTSTAGMPEPLADITRKHVRQLNAFNDRIKRDTQHWENIYKEETGKNWDSLSPEETEPYYNFFLNAGDDTKKFPIKIYNQLNQMRNNIAETTQYALDSGMIKDKKLKATLEAGVKNKNYVNYSYAIHQQPDWAKKVDPKAVQEAKKYLRANLNKDVSKDTLDNMITDILTNTQNKNKLLKTLSKRKDYAPEMRKLFGQRTDIRDVYRDTMGKIHSLAAEHEFRTNFVSMGGDLGVLSRKSSDFKEATPLGEGQFGTSLTLTKEGLSEISEQKSVTNPFDGVYANKAFTESLTALRKSSIEDQNALLQTGAALNSLFTVGHTVYSPETVSRNIYGGGIINVAAGNWMNPLAKAIKLPLNKWKKNSSDMTPVNLLFRKLKSRSILDEGELNLIQEGIEVGILQQGVRAEVLKRNLNDLSSITNKMHQWEKNLNKSPTAKSIKNISFDIPMQFYGLMDDLNKLWAYDSEFRTFKSAYGTPDGKYFMPQKLLLAPRFRGVSILDPLGKGRTSITLNDFVKKASVNENNMIEVSEEILKKMSAKKATDYYPTYDRIPPFIKKLRSTPFGNFVAFPTEMMRTTKNMGLISLEEMYSGNSIMAARGFSRLASLTAVSTGTVWGAVGLTAGAFSLITGSEAGIKPEEVQAFKELQSFEGSGEFYFHSRQVKGDTSVIKASNISYSDPYSVFKNPIRKAMLSYQEGENLETAQANFVNSVREGGYEFLATYTDMKRGLEVLMNAATSTADDGDLTDREIQQIGKEVLKTFSPKVFTTAYDFFIKYGGDEKTEWGTNVPKKLDYAVSILSGGLKPKEYDLDMLASTKLGSINKDIQDDYSSFDDSMQDQNTKNDPAFIREKQDLLREALQNELKHQKRMFRVVHNLRTLGFSDLKIEQVFTKDTSITKDKTLRGTRLSKSKVSNLLRPKPFFIPKDITNMKSIKDLKNIDVYNALQLVTEEYKDKFLN
tara:strand:- start:650 stop:4444 length:3795 start_codon:yes stop_codon:yes gene_type:complete